MRSLAVEYGPRGIRASGGNRFGGSFLAGDAASDINGQAIVVDGALTVAMRD